MTFQLDRLQGRVTPQHARPGTCSEASRHCVCAEFQSLFQPGLPFNPAVEGSELVGGNWHVGCNR